jgi:uncharacterized protein (TIGR03435 family)
MKPKTIRLCAIVGVLAFLSVPMLFASAQTQSTQASAASPDDPKFAKFLYDVVSIKPHKDDSNATVRWMGLHDNPDGFSMRNSPVVFMISTAYRTAHSTISGAPDWAKREMFDVEAKMDPEVTDAFQKLNKTDQELARKHMMQVFVRDYVKAVVHMDTTEVAIYELVIAKNGPKLKEAKEVQEAPDALIPAGALRVSGSSAGIVWTGQGAPIGSMINQLSFATGRPVYDKTGLTGKYDFTLTYARENLTAPGAGMDAPPQMDTAPPLAKALEEQLGLKLVPAKGNMDVIVIDHVERPAAN